MKDALTSIMKLGQCPKNMACGVILFTPVGGEAVTLEEAAKSGNVVFHGTNDWVSLSGGIDLDLTRGKFWTGQLDEALTHADSGIAAYAVPSAWNQEIASAIGEGATYADGDGWAYDAIAGRITITSQSAADLLSQHLLGIWR